MSRLPSLCLLALVLSAHVSVSAVKTKTHAPSQAPTEKAAVTPSSNIEKVEAEIEVFVDEEDLEPLKLATLDDFKNSTTCADLGYPDISAYMYAFPVATKYSSSGGDMFLPVLSTHNLEKKNKDVKKIVLAVHGKEGDADTYFCLAKYAADAYSLRHGKGKDEIAVIAPWFGESQTTGLDWAAGNGKSKYDDFSSVYWDSSGWISSANDATNSSSTFDCMDALVETVLDAKIFPHTKRAALVGFSAGGQVVARYSWANTVSLNNKDSDSEIETFRYIVSDPSSYLYLSPERPNPACIPLYDQGYSTNTESIYCSSFSSSAADVPNIDACSSYDAWKYGVSSFYATNKYSYFAPLVVGGSTAVAKQTERLASKELYFILGADDVCNCNSAGYSNPASCYPTDAEGALYTCTPNDIDSPGCCDTYPASTLNELSTSCGSELQGYSRLQRGLVYMSYLQWYWAGKSYSPNYFVLEGLSHDSATMYKSDILATWAFSDDDQQEVQEEEQDVILVSLKGASKPTNLVSSSASSASAASAVSGASSASAPDKASPPAASSPLSASGAPVPFLLLVVSAGVLSAAYAFRAVYASRGATKAGVEEGAGLLSSKARLVGAI